MSFSKLRIALQVIALAGAASLVAGCSGGNSNGFTQPVPVKTSTWTLGHTIAIPNFPATGGTASFDISFIDPTANQYYLADRSNSGVSVVSTTSFAYVLTAGKGTMSGVKATPPNTSGPNGVLPIGGGLVFAGDGNSTLKVVNVNTGALVATVPTVNPYTGPALPATCGGTGTPTTGAGNARLDEMALDSADGVVMAVNDAACPPFATFFSTTAPYAALGTLAFTTASGGAEQPTWDPTQKKFLVAIPQSLANPGGEVDVVDPKTFTIDKVFPLVNCQPNGTALGQGERLFLGCGFATNPQQIITIDATNGSQVNAIAGLGGCDEVWYNPTANRFYGACSNNVNGPVVVVANGDGSYLTSFGTSTGAHSIAVDPATENIYIPTQKLGLQVYTH